MPIRRLQRQTRRKQLPTQFWSSCFTKLRFKNCKVVYFHRIYSCKNPEIRLNVMLEKIIVVNPPQSKYDSVNLHFLYCDVFS